MGQQGVYQNAGILVVLVGPGNGLLPIQLQAIPKTILHYARLDPREQTSVKNQSNYSNLWVCKMWSIVVSPHCVNESHFNLTYPVKSASCRCTKVWIKSMNALIMTQINSPILGVNDNSLSSIWEIPLIDVVSCHVWFIDYFCLGVHCTEDFPSKFRCDNFLPKIKIEFA